jgi:hypothetical protein
MGQGGKLLGGMCAGGDGDGADFGIGGHF